MDAQFARKMQLNQFRSLVTILHERGISYEVPSDEEVAKMSDADLGSVNRQLSFLARTPGTQR